MGRHGVKVRGLDEAVLGLSRCSGAGPRSLWKQETLLAGSVSRVRKGLVRLGSKLPARASFEAIVADTPPGGTARAAIRDATMHPGFRTGEAL